MKIRAARSDDLGVIKALLAENELPVTDVNAALLVDFLVAEDSGGKIGGCAGLERYNDAGLLRSLTVRPSARDAGVGRALVATVEEAAALQGIERLYLLTTTAKEFFAHNGYREVERCTAPDAIRRTTQFAELCPASATFMAKTL